MKIMIPVLIYDSRSEQEFITQTDKIPETKIVKTPGFTLKGVSFTLEENIILIHYRLNEVHSESSSFRKVVYPEGPIDERVLDDLIELCWTTLYEEHVWYMKVPRSQIAPYPEDAVLDTFENEGYIYLKISDSYKPKMVVRFEETQNDEEIPENVKQLLMSEEPDFDCPEEYKNVDWWEFLMFRPAEILSMQFDKVKYICFLKPSLDLLVYHFIREGEVDDGSYTFHTIHTLNRIVMENEYVLDKIDLSGYIIYKTAKNVRSVSELFFVRK